MIKLLVLDLVVFVIKYFPATQFSIFVGLNLIVAITIYDALQPMLFPIFVLLLSNVIQIILSHDSVEFSRLDIDLALPECLKHAFLYIFSHFSLFLIEDGRFNADLFCPKKEIVNF